MSNPNPPVQPPDEMQQRTNLETAFKILEGIQEQIRFADGKAGFLIALVAILFGFTANNVGDVKALLFRSASLGCPALFFCIPLVLYALCSVLSVVFAVIAVKSRFGGEAPQTKVFFGHIIEKYGHAYNQYAKEMTETVTADWIKEVGTQVLEVSHIASAKHRFLQWSANFAIAAVVLWLLVLAQAMILAGPR